MNHVEKKAAKAAWWSLLEQLIRYGFVGGIAALTEWATFFLFDGIVHWHYMVATVLSFLIATFVNWAVGRCTMFQNAAKGGTACEILGIYFVSGIGLVLNLFLMFFFVEKIGIRNAVAKITATGLVCIWNFISRKLFIYR